MPRLSYESLKSLAERLVSTESQEHVFLPSPFLLVACFSFFIANTLPLMPVKIVIRKASSFSSHTRNSDEQKRIEEFKSLWAEKQINASKTLSTPEVVTGEENTQSAEECHKERSSCEDKQPRECLSMTHERDQHREETASESTLDSDFLDAKKSDELEAAASERDATSPASECQGKDINVEIGDFDYRALLDEKRLYACLLHLAHNTTQQCTLLLTSRTCLPRRLVPGHVVHLKLTARGVCFGEVLPFSPFGPALSSIGRAGEQGALLTYAARKAAKLPAFPNALCALSELRVTQTMLAASDLRAYYHAIRSATAYESTVETNESVLDPLTFDVPALSKSKIHDLHLDVLDDLVHDAAVFAMKSVYNKVKRKLRKLGIKRTSRSFA